MPSARCPSRSPSWIRTARSSPNAAAAAPRDETLELPLISQSLRWLVIGYGNPLRRDDGLGHYLARRVQRALLPGVEVQLEIELLPELALELRRAPRVLFVDASLAPEVSGVQLTRLPGTRAELSEHARREKAPVSHVGGPASLLATCMALYGAMPEGYALAISGYDLGFGVGLSRLARHNLRRARQVAFELLRS